MGLVVLFPLSTDPLRKIPPSRLALWPLDRRERWILRLASPWINPADVGAGGGRGLGARAARFRWDCGPLIAGVFVAAVRDFGTAFAGPHAECGVACRGFPDR